MPWATPALKEVRSLVRDHIRGSLPGADASIPNSVLRVLSDGQAALCHLTLQFIDWLALQLLPDSAEVEWLDRHGDIWLTNADGSTGRKMATLAHGTVEFVGLVQVVVPIATRLTATDVEYETTAEIVTADGQAPTPCPARALDPGSIGNKPAGTALSVALDNIIGASIVTMTGGADTENDDDLRTRILQRIRQPPQGGATHDYVRWALAVAGCTRAWCVPLEMGMGTVTVRVLFDDLRADDDGWPTAADLAAVTAYIDTVRPVAVKDFWVLAPIKQWVDVHIGNLKPDSTEIRSAIEASLEEMFFKLAAPGVTIFAAWKAQAVMNTAGVISFDLMNWDDDVMESPGHMPVLGDIVYGQ
jgi:uncharacterized phage protein gp47/JayE